MSKQHIDFMRRMLQASIRRASRNGAAHPSESVRASVRRRMTLASQCLTMLEVARVDEMVFARALGWKPERANTYHAMLRADIREALARDFLKSVVPDENGGGSDASS